MNIVQTLGNEGYTYTQADVTRLAASAKCHCRPWF